MDSNDDVDLSVLAPPMQPDEALSSWLVRIADAHLITVWELEHILGGSVTGPDRGDLTLLPRIAAMTRVREDVLAQAPLTDLVADPVVRDDQAFSNRFRTPNCWAVCEDCLELDVGQGTPPHIRRAWTHPLATHCENHSKPLICYNFSKIRIAGDVTLYGEPVNYEVFVRYSPILEIVDEMRISHRIRDVLSQDKDESALKELIQLRCAVSDLIDALGTRMRPPQTHALISVFDERLEKMVPRGVRYIPCRLWQDIGAEARLLCTRIAFRIVAEPADPLEDDRQFPTQEWPAAWYRHSRVKGWQSVFTHAIRDPLFLLATELPRTMVLELGERSKAWPADLRRRWTYAAAVGAFSGCVF